MLQEKTLFENVDKEQIAIERIKAFEPKIGYYLAHSGGKDSIVIDHLTKRAGVKYDSHHHLTTIDPPELVRFIKEHCKDVIIEKPKVPFLKKLTERGFPSRRGRWCCEEYKENGGEGRTLLVGIRWAESKNRESRKMVQTCYKSPNKVYVSPIIDWEDSDVWEYIRKHDLPYCKLYDDGWKRIGCLLCPLATAHRVIEAELYPRYKRNFIKAFEKLFKRKKEKGQHEAIARWKNGKEMFEWWMKESRSAKEDANQLTFFDN